MSKPGPENNGNHEDISTRPQRSATNPGSTSGTIATPSPSVPIKIPKQTIFPAFANHARSAPVASSVMPTNGFQLGASFVGSPRSGDLILERKKVLATLPKDAAPEEAIEKVSSESSSDEAEQRSEDALPDSFHDPLFEFEHPSEKKASKLGKKKL
ncbi:MAG: hypothetical protein JSR17_06385 [Proteobacteria bacterium]|nr:hypothetical protein [Pseudomonadota bacterium]